MLLLPKNDLIEIVGLCYQSISDKTVEDIQYGSNKCISALFWILPVNA